MEFIETRELTFKYKKSDKTILKNINVTIDKGEFITVLGRSSSGKTTFLKQFKSFMCDDGIQSGEIFLGGQLLSDIPDYIQNLKIYYMPQEFNAQYIMRKTIDEIIFGIEDIGIKNLDIDVRLAEICSILNINDVLNEDVSALSGGQRQLVRLATALILKPDLIILDEPLLQLDPINSKIFVDILERINKEFSITILLSSNNLNYTYEFSDKIFFMNELTNNIDVVTKKDLLKFSENRDYFFYSLPLYYQVGLICGNSNFQDGILNTKEVRRCLDENIKNILLHNAVNENKHNRTNNNNLLPPLLDVKNIWFKYSMNSDYVLKNLELKIRSGEIVSIVGNNGCGKSTLLEMICKIHTPNRGKIYYDGKYLKKYKDIELFLNNISLLPQYSPILITEDNVYDTLSISKTYLSGVRDEDIQNVCKKMGIIDLLYCDTNRLSMGNKQLVVLAKLILTSPRLLLLDEPTINLDIVQKEKLKNILKNIAQNGTAVLMVSHDLDFCAEISDKCGLLFQGRIVKFTNTKEFFLNNYFYTTQARLITMDMSKNIITNQEVLDLCYKTKSYQIQY